MNQFWRFSEFWEVSPISRWRLCKTSDVIIATYSLNGLERPFIFRNKQIKPNLNWVKKKMCEIDQIKRNFVIKVLISKLSELFILLLQFYLLQWSYISSSNRKTAKPFWLIRYHLNLETRRFSCQFFERGSCSCVRSIRIYFEIRAW